MPQVRMKSGIQLIESGRWELVVHVWADGDTSKEPMEYTSAVTFVTEEVALEHYKKVTRPMLYEMVSKISKDVRATAGITPLD